MSGRICLLLFPLLLPSTLRAFSQETVAVQPAPVVSVFAGGNYGPGGWVLDIDPQWRLKTRMIGESDAGSRTRLLTREEQRKLLELLAALPTERMRYHVGKTVVIDASVSFALTVGLAKEARRYVVMDPLYEEKDRPELKPILNALHFLRGLFKSPTAHHPPLLEGSPK